MKNKTIIFLVLVILALLFLYNTQENFTMTEQSNEAVQNIASVYANTSGTITVNNLNATGATNLNNLDVSGTVNVSGTMNVNSTITTNNLNASGLTNLNNLDISGTTNLSNININGSISYNNSKPFTLTISIGVYKGPIYDTSGNTFPIDKYTIKQISGANVAIGVRNNKWWITQFPTWNAWTQAVVEIISIPLNQYYSSYSNSGAITVDARDDDKFQNGGEWGIGPINSGLSNYVVYDGNGNKYVLQNNVTVNS